MDKLNKIRGDPIEIRKVFVLICTVGYFLGEEIIYFPKIPRYNLEHYNMVYCDKLAHLMVYVLLCKSIELSPHISALFPVHPPCSLIHLYTSTGHNNNSP